MRKFSFLYLLLLLSVNSFGQEDSTEYAEVSYIADRDAKYAVSQILFYCGLDPNFKVVIDFKIPNAQAYIHKKKRYIRYNPDFLRRMIDSTDTDWAAWSVLAHEIGHHLLGHTVEKYKFSYDYELAADRFSGFILNKMGATLDESLSCIEKAGSTHGTKTHPAIDQRKEAITIGWKQGEESARTVVDSFSTEVNWSIDENFTHRIQFNGELTSYYINQSKEVIWYDNYAKATKISSLKKSKSKTYEWEFILEKSTYGLDRGGEIWLITTHGANIQVGTAEFIGSTKK